MESTLNEDGSVSWETAQSKAFVRKNALHYAMRIEEKNSAVGNILIDDLLSTATILEKWLTGESDWPIDKRTNPL